MITYVIIVLDYCSGSIRWFRFENEPEDPESWLLEHDPQYKESQCNWMGVSGEEVPETFYHVNEDCTEVTEG